jgi:predicted  nucleic acid-binding Zn-ribbon protein
MPHQCTDCSRRFDDGSKEMLSGCPNCGGNKFQYIPTAAMDADGTPGETPADQPRSGDTDSTVARTVGSAATAVRDLVGGSSRSGGSPPSDVPASPETGTEGGARSATAGRPETSSPSNPATASADSDSNADSDSDADPDPESPKRGRSDTGTADGSTQTGNTEPSTGRSDFEPSTSASDIEATTGTSEDAAQASARSELVSPDELPSVADERSGWEQATPAPTQEPQPSGPETDPDAGSPGEQAAERPDLSELREELNQQFESIKVVEPGQYELNLMELFDRQEYIIALQEDGKYTVQVPEHWQD